MRLLAALRDLLIISDFGKEALLQDLHIGRGVANVGQELGTRDKQPDDDNAWRFEDASCQCLTASRALRQKGIRLR